jgi:hypothetical protein
MFQCMCAYAISSVNTELGILHVLTLFRAAAAVTLLLPMPTDRLPAAGGGRLLCSRSIPALQALYPVYPQAVGNQPDPAGSSTSAQSQCHELRGISNPKQCTKITGEDLTCPEGQDLSCCNRKECGTFIQFVEQYVIENPEIHELGSALVLLPFFKPACEKAGKGHYLACCSQPAKRL